MDDERYPVISRVAVGAAALDVAPVPLWRGAFALRTGIADAHLGWHVAVPPLLLVGPGLVLFASRFTLNGATADAGCLPWTLLGFNLVLLVTCLAVPGRV